MSLLSLFGWVLACVSTLSVTPQVIRLYRINDSSGISLHTVVLATATMLLWCEYTITKQDWPAFGSSVGPLLAWSAILFWFLRFRATGILRPSLVAVFYVAVCSIAHVPHWGGVAGSLLWALPQAYKAASSNDLSGISSAAYYAIAAENIGWIIYAAGTGHWAYAVAPAVQAPLALLIAIRAARSKPATSLTSR